MKKFIVKFTQNKKNSIIEIEQECETILDAYSQTVALFPNLDSVRLIKEKSEENAGTNTGTEKTKKDEKQA